MSQTATEPADGNGHPHRHHQVHRLPRPARSTCKQWNDLAGREDRAARRRGWGCRTPRSSQPKTFVVLTFTRDRGRQGAGRAALRLDQAPVHALRRPGLRLGLPGHRARTRTADGAVTYDADKCLGCRYCMWACPLGVPTAEWDSLAPKIRKCTHCARPRPSSRPRGAQRPGAHRRGQASASRRRTAIPACVKQCPAGALQVRQPRTTSSSEAHARIAEQPRQVRRPRLRREGGGRHRACCTWPPCPSSSSACPRSGMESYPARSVAALGAVPPAVIGVGRRAGRRLRPPEAHRSEVATAEDGRSRGRAPPRVRAGRRGKLWTPANLALAAVMALRARSPSWPGSPSAWAAPPTCPTPTPGASGSSSTWSGSRSPPAPSPWPA